VMSRLVAGHASGSGACSVTLILVAANARHVVMCADRQLTRKGLPWVAIQLVPLWLVRRM